MDGCRSRVYNSSYYAVIAAGLLSTLISRDGAYGAGAAGRLEILRRFVTNTFPSHSIQPFSCWLPYGCLSRHWRRVLKSTAKLNAALFGILLILIVRSVTLEGAGKGLEFYLKPDFSKITGDTFLAALGQAFFSLSLGMGCMITYGSYLTKDTTIPSAVGQICFLDTMVALLAGLVIFRLCFAFAGSGAGPADVCYIAVCLFANAWRRLVITFF